LIEKTFALDPRPLVYRGFEGQDSPYRRSHAFRLLDADIHFQFVNPSEAVVTNILELENSELA
ncbi:MAG: tRNA (N6-threonylcarbamoyladenosine(37)-N6)-methyltransferase TrmO, partial [Bdellovibrionaceae bacterium]|nr:tRNA (N6-threonylcarbamoyladenosine(37)-N6)-methyltransferase TrmO [Pseudobdellovibrionaceae bacterium]